MAQKFDIPSTTSIVVMNATKIPVGTPDPLFATFSPWVTLSNGLTMVRSLGNNKFEIIDQDDVSQDLVRSEEVRGALLTSSLGFCRENWGEIKKCCKLAYRIRTKDIFPFQKLPVEIRDMIYDLVLTFSQPIIKFRHPRHPKKLWRRYDKPLHIGMMFVCRQFYEEGRSSFWRRNTFRHCNYSPEWLNSHPNYTDNVRNVQFYWKGLKRDSESFRDMSTFPKLKILNLLLEHKEDRIKVLDMKSPISPKKLSANVTEIREYSQAPGIDKLVQIRGLKRVDLTIYSSWCKPSREQLQKKKELETFLKETLTLRRDPLNVPTRRAPRKPRNPKLAEANATAPFRMQSPSPYMFPGPEEDDFFLTEACDGLLSCG